jgi:hypothetical protein
MTTFALESSFYQFLHDKFPETYHRADWARKARLAVVPLLALNTAAAGRPPVPRDPVQAVPSRAPLLTLLPRLAQGTLAALGPLLTLTPLQTVESGYAGDAGWSAVPLGSRRSGGSFHGVAGDAPLARVASFALRAGTSRYAG